MRHLVTILYRKESSYFVQTICRFFNRGITNAVVVSSVEFGQGSANDGKEVFLNLYVVDIIDLQFATTFDLIGTASHMVKICWNTHPKNC